MYKSCEELAVRIRKMAKRLERGSAQVSFALNNNILVILVQFLCIFVLLKPIATFVDN
jgi:hypothetical protein